MMNDNDATDGGHPLPFSDPHGMAALLLVESLVHELCGKFVLSNAEAVNVAECAISVQYERAVTAADRAEPMWRAHALLLAIAASLKTDGHGVFTRPRLVDAT